MLVLASSVAGSPRLGEMRETASFEPKELMNDKTNKTEKAERSRTFFAELDRVLERRGMKKADLCDEQDAVVGRILREYGAIFVADERVLTPPVCMFEDASHVESFQAKAGIAAEEISGAMIELQPAALEALLAAREEARKKGLDITPRDGTEAGRRHFADTVRLWKSRFDPACKHWKKRGKLTDEQIEALNSLPVKEQVAAVLELEKQGVFFNTFFNNSILYSVAAPGTSQHLSMLAFDAAEFADPQIRRILAKHGWFRTVRNDDPHFTFLGRRESELEKLGLRKLSTEKGEYWIPNV